MFACLYIANHTKYIECNIGDQPWEPSTLSQEKEQNTTSMFKRANL